MRARILPVEELPGLSRADWVDPARRPYVAEGLAWVPVKAGYSFDTVLDERRPYHGRGYQMIGDIAVIHGESPSKEELKTLIAWKRPRAIVHLLGFDGVERRPRTRILYGEPGEVTHRENGYLFVLDPTKVMFSMGNRAEKARTHRSITGTGREERVADMYAGIGYFTLPAAGGGARVHAMEINRDAFEYLEHNIALNGVEERVHAQCGDCRTLLRGIYDRVIMGHFDAVTMLDAVLPHVETGSIIHLHSIGPVTETILAKVRGAGFSARIASRRVKKYAPRRWHLVHDVELV